MTFPKEDFNWGNLWADLLKGAGRGLLEFDGSRAAQAALAGLDVFDAAQERRRQEDRQQPGDSTHQDALLKLWPTLSPAERAAFLRLPTEERIAWAEELAQVQSDGAPQPGSAPLANRGVQPPVAASPVPHAGRPISVNPLDGLRLQSVLPFGPDGRLNLPTYRR